MKLWKQWQKNKRKQSFLFYRAEIHLFAFKTTVSLWITKLLPQKPVWYHVVKITRCHGNSCTCATENVSDVGRGLFSFEFPAQIETSASKEFSMQYRFNLNISKIPVKIWQFPYDLLLRKRKYSYTIVTFILNFLCYLRMY
jgi:hypothetical protein